jgi:hypothetical protein
MPRSAEPSHPAYGLDCQGVRQLNNRNADVNDVKQKVEAVLCKLIGQPLVEAGRAADMLTLQFGTLRLRENSLGRAIEVGRSQFTSNAHGALLKKEKFIRAGVTTGNRQIF